jgi:hypothetical protein
VARVHLAIARRAGQRSFVRSRAHGRGLARAVLIVLAIPAPRVPRTRACAKRAYRPRVNTAFFLALVETGAPALWPRLRVATELPLPTAAS